ncbi:MAG: hypothetical protein ABEI97_00820 [Candidatus Nanohaloarchaea archaeon]
MFDWFGDDDENREERMDEERREEINDILNSYEQRFDEDLGGDTGRERVASRDYQAYKEAEREAQKTTWYEKLVNRISFFRYEFDDLEQEHRNALRLIDYDLAPDQIVPAALVVAVVTAITVTPVLLADLSMLFKVFAVSVPLGMFYYISKYPQLKARQKVVRSSENLILAILYMVIYMRSTPNLEGAIIFASRHLEGPVAKDLKLMLWRLDVREYTTVREALADYIDRWRPYNQGFVQALNLIKSATAEAKQQKRNEVLTEAIETLLEDTQDRMDEFAHQLKMPVMALYAIGILLPVLAIILFPMVAAFMGGGSMAIYLALLYNLIIPLTVYLLMKNLLISRPLSLSSRTGKLMETHPGTVEVSVLDRDVRFNVAFLSIPLFLVMAAWPAPHYYQAFVAGGGMPIAPDVVTFFRELMMVLAVSVPVGVHLAAGYISVVRNQEKIQTMEDEFPEVLFELANALERGKPVELAVEDVAREEKRLDISDMFAALSHNMRERGMTFHDALFDSEYGAMRQYPSKLMQTVMEVLSESAEKGPGVAASAASSISEYLQRIKETQKRLEELIEDTLSSVQFLGYILAPVIAGVAVGLGGVISLAFDTIQQVAGSAQPPNATGPGGGAGFGGETGLLSIFQIHDAIPPGVLQLVVGLYLIQISFIIGTMYVRLADGRNPAKRNVMIGKLLLVAIPLYTLVTLILIVVFGSMIKGVAP